MVLLPLLCSAALARDIDETEANLAVAATADFPLDGASIITGDIDGDGNSDLIVASPGAGAVPLRVAVWLGPDSGARTLATADLIIADTIAHPSVVVYAADITDPASPGTLDGAAEVIVGLPDTGLGGRVFVFAGEPDLATAPGTTWYLSSVASEQVIDGTTAGERLGASFASGSFDSVAPT